MMTLLGVVFLGRVWPGAWGPGPFGPPCGALPAPAAGEPDFCVTVCNHWSYTGIGWQLGIESSVLSVTDAMEMADREPHVKTCINLDARAYAVMAEKFPEVAAKLTKYLAAGKVELIGGTYGQPMGTTIGGESNIRQMVTGRETIRKALGYEMATFLEEEEFSHPQIPQMVTLAGFRSASLAQLDTWGRAGCPRQDLNAFHWKGLDGTTIPCVPKNALFGYSPDLKRLAGSADFRNLKKLGTPLIFCWEEFGWESPESPAYLTSPAKYIPLAAQARVEFVTLREYLDKYISQAKETVFLPMDAWNKSLTWGLGGDQVRVLDRKLEGLLLAAEVFDAAASAPGPSPRLICLTRRGRISWPRRAMTWGCASIPAGKVTAWPRPNDSKTSTTSPGARSATTTLTLPRNRVSRPWMLRWQISASGLVARPSPPGRWSLPS